MDYCEALRWMNGECSDLTYAQASKAIGRPKGYLQKAAKTNGLIIRAGTYVMAANAYRFYVSVVIDGRSQRLMGPERIWTNAEAVTAAEAVAMLVERSGKTPYQLALEIGRSDTYVYGLLREEHEPEMRDLILLAKACGSKVVVSGHDKKKVLEAPRREGSGKASKRPSPKPRKARRCQGPSVAPGGSDAPDAPAPVPSVEPAAAGAQDVPGASEGPREGHFAYAEGRTGFTYEGLFWRHFEGARSLRIVDPYVRSFAQRVNLLELMVLFRELADPSVRLGVHLVTSRDERDPERQERSLVKMRDSMAGQRLDLTWEYASGIHARHIFVDDAWDIQLDRGLDIWHSDGRSDLLRVESHVQEARSIRGFEVTYRRMDA